MSRTDVECSWKKRNAPDISRKSISEMFPPTKPGYTALLRQPNQGDQEALYSELRAYGKFTGLCWLLSPEPKQLGDLPVLTVEEQIFSGEFLTLSTAAEQLEFIRPIKGQERNCKSNQLFNSWSEKQSLPAFSKEGALDCKQFWLRHHC